MFSTQPKTPITPGRAHIREMVVPAVPLEAGKPIEGKTAHLLTCAKRRRHKLTLADVESIAALVARRASEAEACAVLDIPYSTWAHFKGKPRNAERFDKIFKRIRGGKIQSHMDNIDKCSSKDWRASEAYLEKIMPDRFSSKAAIADTAQPISEGWQVMAKLLDKLYRDHAKSEAVVECPPAKQTALT